MSGSESERAQVWLERGRPDLAEKELRKALANDPEDAWSHTLLALCLVDLDRHAEAQDESMRALALDADLPLAHYARAAALAAQGRYKPAEQAVRHARDLEPAFAPAFGLLAQVLAGQHRWKEALAAAEEGLEADPEDETCANLRALALIQLGQGEEADFALTAALERDPEDPLTHQNIGWKALRSGDADRAIVHYREALRLDPQSETARAGLVEALKSRNVVYRLFLRLFLLLTRVPPRTVMMIFIGTVLARIVLRRVADAAGPLAPVLWLLFWALVVFVFMTWIASPLFNLLLRLDREGRHALTAAQRRQTTGLALTLLAAAAAYGASLLGVPWTGIAAIFLATLTIPVCATLSPDPGTNRRLLGAMTAGLAIVAALSIFHGMEAERRRQELVNDVRARFEAKGIAPESLVDVTKERLAELTEDWSEEDSRWLESLAPRREAIGAAETRALQFIRYFFFGFVAFTWIAAGASTLHQSR